MKSSGKKREFATGAVRDSAEGKARMELIPWELMMRVADWYALGAEKYGDNNWRRGQPQSACFGCALRHLIKWSLGWKDEDHLAAVIWNVLSLMNVETYYLDNPAVADMEGWFVDGKPTGKGSYENERYHNEKKAKEGESNA